MSQLFQRKPIADLLPDGDARSLKRVLGAGDLIMLAIGAVIGAGIFCVDRHRRGRARSLPDGEVVRYGAGPALVFSFLLLGGVCALAALCYAELASMIPQAGSAYAYSYATLGELVAWIIGWDLILEYAVGNVAVAIAWGGYFTSLLARLRHRPAGLADARLSHGAPQLRSRRSTALLQTAPQHRRHPDPAQHAGVRHRDARSPGCCCVGVQESVARQQHHGGRQAAGAGAVRRRRRDAHRHRRTTRRSRRTAYAASTRARRSSSSPTSASTRSRPRPRRRKNPQRNLPIGILGGLAICTVIYVDRRRRATGLVPYQQLRGGRSAGARARARRAADGRLDRRARRGGLDDGGAAGVPVRPAAHLLRDGARRPAAGSGRRRSTRRRACRTSRRSSPASSSRVGVARRRRGRDLRPHQHRHAVRVRARLHRRAGAARTRSPTGRGRSGCRSSGRSALLGAAACLFIDGRACRARPGSASASGW